MKSTIIYGCCVVAGFLAIVLAVGLLAGWPEGKVDKPKAKPKPALIRAPQFDSKEDYPDLGLSMVCKGRSNHYVDMNVIPKIGDRVVRDCRAVKYPPLSS